MSDTLSFLKKRFSDYYEETELYLPERFGKREWGFMFLGENFMKRHMAFGSVKELKEFLVKKTPAHVYHSAAYYGTPGASTMAEKNWLGADLIFDLDADHIKGAEHMSYEETLAKVKKEFIKLIDNFLLDDFGFHEDQLFIVFSGGRGYHIHIRDPRILQLSSHERREIVDYITGKEIDMNWVFEEMPFDKRSFGTHVKVMHKVMMPKEDEGGWKKKMREGIRRLTDELESLGEKEALKRLKGYEGVGTTTARGMYSDLFSGEKGKRGIDRMRNENILEIFSDNKHLYTFLDIVKGDIGVKLGAKKELIDNALLPNIKDEEGETDEPVTSDVRRLIRLPSSLHGKTGFMVTPLSRDELDGFEPLRDAIPPIFTDEPVKLRLKDPVSINLKNEAFNLDVGDAEVPEFAAIFLLCRRNAILPS